MGGEKIPTPFDALVEVFKDDCEGRVRVTWNIDGMHVEKVQG